MTWLKVISGLSQSGNGQGKIYSRGQVKVRESYFESGKLAFSTKAREN